jgi:hypothetical protein
MAVISYVYAITFIFVKYRFFTFPKLNIYR